MCIGVLEGIGGPAGEWGQLIEEEQGKNQKKLGVGRDHRPQVSGPCSPSADEHASPSPSRWELRRVPSRAERCPRTGRQDPGRRMALV